MNKSLEYLKANDPYTDLLDNESDVSTVSSEPIFKKYLDKMEYTLQLPSNRKKDFIKVKIEFSEGFNFNCGVGNTAITKNLNSTKEKMFKSTIDTIEHLQLNKIDIYNLKAGDTVHIIAGDFIIVSKYSEDFNDLAPSGSCGYNTRLSISLPIFVEILEG